MLYQCMCAAVQEISTEAETVKITKPRLNSCATTAPFENSFHGRHCSNLLASNTHWNVRREKRRRLPPSKGQPNKWLTPEMRPHVPLRTWGTVAWTIPQKYPKHQFAHQGHCQESNTTARPQRNALALVASMEAAQR